MVKYLTVLVNIGANDDEGEIRGRVDDVLADVALGPCITEDASNYEDEGFEDDVAADAEGAATWKPTPGTALDFIYKKRGLVESKKSLKEDKNWPPKAQAVFDRLAGINDAEELGWGEYYGDTDLWGDTDFKDGCCFAFTDNFDENDPYWDSYNEDDFEDDSDFIEYVKGNKKLFDAAKKDLDDYVEAWNDGDEDDEDLDEAKIDRNNSRKHITRKHVEK